MPHKIDTERILGLVVSPTNAIAHSKDETAQSLSEVLDAAAFASDRIGTRRGLTQVIKILFVVEPINENRFHPDIEVDQHLPATGINVRVAVVLDQAKQRRLEV